MRSSHAPHTRDALRLAITRVGRTGGDAVEHKIPYGRHYPQYGQLLSAEIRSRCQATLTLLTVRTQMQTLTVVPADPEVVASAARFTQSTRACWAIPLAAEPLRDWRNFVALMIITSLG